MVPALCNLIRITPIRAGSTGFCATGYVPQISGKDSDGKDKNPAPAFEATPDNHWGLWVMGSGQSVSVGNDDANATGYAIEDGSFTFGLDYRLLHNLAFGVYGGYNTGTATLVDGGEMRMSGGDVGGYATWFWRGFYVDASGGGAWNNYKTDRVALLGDALGSTNGTEYNALGALGYDWHVGCFNVGPRATIQYVDVSIDEFTETGSLAPLEIQDQDVDSLQSTVGVRATYDIHGAKPGVLVRPELDVAWLHEYNDKAYPIDSRLASGAGDVFTVWGPTVGRDAAQVRAGLNMQLATWLSVYVYYDGLLGRGNYDNNGGSGGFTLSF